MILTILASVGGLTACEEAPSRAYPNDVSDVFKKRCLEGVAYWVRPANRMMAPVFKPDSTVETCNRGG